MALQQHRIYTSRHNYTAFYLDWSEEWISGGAENYSRISWRVGIHASGANPSWYSNSIKILSSNLGGNGLTTGTWSNQNLTNGESRQLGNGSFNYGHNSAGAAVISGSIQGWLYGYGNTSTASGSWNLTNIPRYAVINSTQGNFNDETANIYISYTNPPGGSITGYLYVRPGTSGSWTHIATRSSYGSGANFSLTTGERNSLRSALSSTMTGQALLRVANSVGNTDTIVGLSIVNAQPIFTTYTYQDTNAAMVAITGDDQVLVQNPGGLTNPTSTLEMTISTGNKAVATKEASMVDYLVTLGAFSAASPYSATLPVVATLGAIDLTGTAILQVRARDSRANFTQVDTGITVLPYSMPIISAQLSRSDDFDAAVKLEFPSIKISSITVGGADKNGIKSSGTGTADRIEYRYKIDSGAYTAWTDRTASVSTGVNGVSTVTVSSLNIVPAPTANNTYTAQVRVTDKLGNATTSTIYLGSGQPIFRVGTDGNIYYNEVSYQSFDKITSSASVTPDGSSSFNQLIITAQAASLSIGAPSGTLTDGNRLLIRIKDNGTARSISFDAIFRAVGLTLPTVTVANKTTYIGAVYNEVSSKWDIISVQREI